MKHIKLTLAITLTALAFLCACDDSSSAKDESSENDATPTQPPPQSNTITANEQYTYVFYNNDENGCGGEPAILNIQYKLAPSSSIAKMTIKTADETITESGMFREITGNDGSTYYLIQLKDDAATYIYIPNKELIITVGNVAIAGYFKDPNTVNALIAETCAE